MAQTAFPIRDRLESSRETWERLAQVVNDFAGVWNDLSLHDQDAILSAAYERIQTHIAEINQALANIGNG